MSKTMENLKEAFAGESQANRKYLAFADKADQENMPYAARLFRAAAAAETLHAHAHLRAMKGIGTTAENLKAAVEGETYEYTKMYPPMIEDAKAEGEKAAERGMTLANAAEKVHAELFKGALANPSQPAQKVYVCQVCGHISIGSVPEKCPICGGNSKAYKEID